MSSGNESPGQDVQAGFEAVRARAALSLLDDRSLLVATGEDRSTFLQGMLSNEIVALEAGQGTHALLLTEQGRVVADLRVYALESEAWVECPASARDDVRAGLERFIVADDVELNASDSVGIAVRGPGAVGIVAAVSGEDLTAFAEGQHRLVHVSGVAIRVVRLSDLGIDAFHLWLPAGDRDPVLAALREHGAEDVSDLALEAQRVVAGIGRLGTEYGLDTLAPEVPSLERAISYKKGCYLGQEVVERIASRGKVNWKIATLRAAGSIAPGDAVRTSEGEVGHVTSVVRRPDDGAVWALARIRATASAPGTAVTIETGGKEQTAEVVSPAPQE